MLARRPECDLTEQRHGRSDAIALFEVLGDDDAALVEHERPGIRDAVVFVADLHAIKSVLFDDVLIEQRELANRAAARVRQQRKRDAVLLGEAGQDLNRVLAQPEDSHAS